MDEKQNLITEKKLIKIEHGLEELDSALDGLSVKTRYRGLHPKDIFTIRSASLTTCGDVESNPGPGIGR